MRTDERIMKQALSDISFAIEEPYKNAVNDEGPTYRSLITAMGVINTILRDTDVEINTHNPRR